MPVGIPDSSREHRYRQRDPAAAAGSRVRAADALRAYAEDLLETGNARIALERAFRWGYQTETGERVAGLQEHLQELRHQRDRLTSQALHESFLESLAPELDRLDALDRAAGAGVSDDHGESPALDRFVDRLQRGYASEQAQEGLDQLRAEIQQVARAEREASSRRVSEGRGPGQPSSPFGALRGASQASLDSLRQMVFEGGIAERPGEAEGWRRRTAGSPIRGAFQDLALLAELDVVEAELEQLESVGGVTDLAGIDLAGVQDDALSRWLDDWTSEMATVLPAGAGAPGPPMPLPPEVISAIGRDLLKGLFRAARSPATGDHHALSRGNAGDSAESLTAWEPGRPLDLDLVATLSSAIRRDAGHDRGRIRLAPDDFVVVERASSVSVSTVLAIDRSRSMGQSGAWTSAKKVGMAMHELIRQSYPRDSLGIVSFSSTATPVEIGDVPALEWDRFEHGTHLQAALALGRRMLRARSAGTRQIVVITDGEPTLATVGGEDIFASPPTDAVLNATMAEVIRCTREEITINVVMLGEGPGTRFAEQVARVNRGRVFIASKDNLGSFILRDYIAR